MSQPDPPKGRLRPTPTCRVDFTRPLDFTFLGRPMRGFKGDTVASALYASGVRIFSRSLKYHRARGLYTLEGESANTYMAIDGTPNECAETTELKAGMSIHAQNVRGNPKTDIFAPIDAFDHWMPAGFYYRIFHRPYRLWPLFQNALRRMAGTGVLSPHYEPRSERLRAERYLNAEVAIVGGGPSGLSAALAAAQTGIRVCLFEKRPWLGGHLAWRTRKAQHAETLAKKVQATDNIRVFTRSPVTGVWGENLLTGFTTGTDDDPFHERHWECRAKTVVIAAGCMDRPLVFNHNDRPGVMQPTTAWRLATTYGVPPGRTAVFSLGDDLSLEAALDLTNLGTKIRAVADAREPNSQDPTLIQALKAKGIPVLEGWAASRALGRNHVKGCELRPTTGEGSRRFRCDLIVANAGRQPRLGTLATAKAQLAYCTHTHTYQPVALPPGLFTAGSMTGLRDLRAIEASGRLAGHRAATWPTPASTSRAVAPTPPADPPDHPARPAHPGPAPGCPLSHGPHIGRGAKAFVDLDEDGTWKNVKECVRQGFDAPELAKRFGGFGLGPGQYRVSGQNLAMIMAELRGDPVESATPTTVRPPLAPPSLATLAGPNHDVHKRTPLHGEQAVQGAVFRRAEPWLRARYFSDDRECRDEILNVRNNVGILDSSPLGKFRIWGPDALAALQRVYISDMTRARPGKCKYSAMCNDMGQLVDDGVVVKEGANEYYLTTSSTRAGATAEWFRYHTRHDGWDYNMVNLTDVLASINIAGPNAREVLRKVATDDVSNEALPYLTCKRVTVGGVAARCLRLGFVGELSFELHVPSSYCQYVWDLLTEAGAAFGIRPFGLEAQYCLRAEKGHVIIGAESEARVTLTDIGMGWLWDRDDTASKKVGAPALRAAAQQPGRMKLVGFVVDAGQGSPRDGALIVSGDEIVGYACTTRRSDTLGQPYGMALVRDDHAVQGAALSLQEEPVPGKRATYSARVTSSHFYDPNGKRMRA